LEDGLETRTAKLPHRGHVQLVVVNKPRRCTLLETLLDSALHTFLRLSRTLGLASSFEFVHRPLAIYLIERNGNVEPWLHGLRLRHNRHR
jgi:hypothetical protein